MNELESLKKQIIYRASYRGTKEMDLLLSSFISSVVNILSYDELKILDNFLNLNDEVIYDFYLNNNSINLFHDRKILDLFKNFKV